MNFPVTGSLLIGLTGGIASGKSTVLQHLRQAGYSVIDADKLGHKVLEQGNPGYNKVVKCFGNEILNPDGSVNRTALGRIVFVDAEKLKQLNEISHPIIAEMIQKEFEESVSDSNGGIVFLEAALLIEANWYKICGHIWVVSLDQTVALRRLKERDNLSETEAKLRVGAQLDQEERLAYADVVLQNEGTPEELFTKTQQALRELKQSMNSSHS
ncbi:MAG: dephospho-CoA kinase [SAR324 cluster bacterium]|uniref:Dephospho-CoA kinase n=1 Tax=SAR324 cluster bacterium TaxID=2024889 RepID=A0A432GM10_9DELT|nr:MAG: dephospho-CoA kinase [SAR324 cluster bacterium]